MPRLPVNDAAPEDESPRATIVVTRWGASLALGLLALSVAGDVLLADWLRLDLSCIDSGHGRRARLAQLVICSAAAGPLGWFYLAWLAAPAVLAAW